MSEIYRNGIVSLSQQSPTINHSSASYLIKSGGLYLGDIDCAQDPFLLQQLNIGAMLSVIDEPQVILPEYMNYLVREVLSWIKRRPLQYQIVRLNH